MLESVKTFFFFFFGLHSIITGKLDVGRREDLFFVFGVFTR